MTLAERRLSHGQASSSGARAPARPAWVGSRNLHAPPLSRQLRQWGRPRTQIYAQQAPTLLPTAARLLEDVDYKVMYEDRPPASIDVEYLWSRLDPLLWYLAPGERAMVREGLELAVLAHSGQRRKSGEPFITHPVEVTRILAEMRMDAESLVAGLLHDTVEDTDAVCFDDIERRFGSAVRRIVEGETKISKITKVNSSTDNYSDDKARDLQGLFMAMTEDVRVILVKLADRLHNMRTLYGMTAAKQAKISQETLQVFAPLAKLLGVYCIKEELEDLSLRYMQPEVYKHIKSWQDKQMATYQRAFATGKADLEALLASDGYLQSHARGVEVRVRRKPAYSVFKQLRALQAARQREEEAMLQETVAAGAAAAAAEAALEAAAARRAAAAAAAAANGLNGKGPAGSNGTAAAPAGSSSSNGAGAAVPPAAQPQQQQRPVAGPRAGPKPELGLLAHLKDLSDQGVFLQVVINERGSGGAGAGAADGSDANGNGSAAPRRPQQPLFQMESHQLCYYVLGLVHSIWSPIPGGLEDFIGSPKTNGYQSLHTRVVPLSILSKNCPLLPMEVQIRTADMDVLADLGVAASNWGVKRPPGRGASWAAFGGMAVAAARADAMQQQRAAAAAAVVPLPQQEQSQQQQQQQQAEWMDEEEQLPATSGGSESGSSSSGSSSSGGGARAFWMNLATYMLETVVAGGTSLAAITGVRPHLGSPFNSRDDDTSGDSSGWGCSGSRSSSPMPAKAAGSNGAAAAPPNGNGARRGWGGSNGAAPAAGQQQQQPRDAPAAPNGFLPASLQRREAASDGNWLTQMRKWQEEFVGSLSAREFVDGVTAEVLGQSVFVYTHTGELRRLPKGSTVVDFAYSVHTQLGNEMRAALVNGRLVAPSYVLSNGEVVEVRREPSATVTPSMVRRHEQWVGFVRTRTAKLKIKQFLKEHARRQRRCGGGTTGGSGTESSCEEDDMMCSMEEGYSDGGAGGAAPAAGAVAGNGAGTAAAAVVRPDAVSVKTLTLSCADKMGLLAAICNIITEGDHNIKSVSALPGRRKDSSSAAGPPVGEYVMTFVLKGRDDRLPDMIGRIGALEGVDTYSVSCELPPPPGSGPHLRGGNGKVAGGGGGGGSGALSVAVGLWALAAVAAGGGGGALV